MTIKNKINRLKKNEVLDICGPNISFKMTGTKRVYINRDGMITVIYSDDSKAEKHAGCLLESEIISVFEAVSLVQS